LQTLARRAGIEGLLPALRGSLPALLAQSNPAVHASLLQLLVAVLPPEEDNVAGATKPASQCQIWCMTGLLVQFNPAGHASLLQLLVAMLPPEEHDVAGASHAHTL